MFVVGLPFSAYFILFVFLRCAGFLSLEEIDEAEYGLDIPEPEDGKRKTKKKKSIQNEDVKKQQQDEVDGASSDEVEAELDESVKAKEKKKKKKKKTKKKDATDGQKVEQPDAGNFFFSFKLIN